MGGWLPHSRRSGPFPRCCCTTTWTAGCARPRSWTWPARSATTGCPPHDAGELEPLAAARRGHARPPEATTWRRSSTRSAVMQTREALIRVAAECAEDLAADGVVYAEVRFAPELHVAGGLSLDQVVEAVLEGFRRGSAGRRHHRVRAAHRDAHGGALAGDRRARGAAPRRGRGRLRHRRRRGGQPAEPAPGRVPVRGPGELPHHDPRRGGVRAAVDLGGAAVVRRRAARPRGADHGRHPDRRRTGTRPLGRLASYVRDRRIPLEMCPTSNVQTGAAAVHRGAPDRAAAPAVLPGHGQHRQPADERGQRCPRSSRGWPRRSGTAGPTSSGSRSTR